MKIISIINQKGGTGKTTTAFNISSYLAMKNFKTLVIDLDPQANLSFCFGLENIENTSYELLTKNICMPLKINEHLDIIPSSIRLSKVEYELVNAFSRETILKDIISNLNYDFIIIDCPPSLGILSFNSLVASNFILAPVQCEPLSVEGLDILISTLETIFQRMKKNISYLVVPTMIDIRNNISIDILNYLQNNYNTTNSYIRRNVKLSELAVVKKNIFSYASNSYGAKDYENVAKEVIELVSKK